MNFVRFCVCLLPICLLFSSIQAAESAPPAAPSAPPPIVFELPLIQARFGAMQVQILGLFKEGKYVEAEKQCREAIQLIPQEPSGHYNLACALARQGKLEEAVKALDQAVSLGFKDARHIEQDKDLAALKDRPDFKKIVEKAPSAKPDPKAAWKYTIEPKLVENGVALVTQKNTLWDARVGVFRGFFKFPEKGSQPGVNGMGEAGKLLRQWHKEGTTAGNHGDLYDNHDSGHSNMDYGAFPQLARIEFDEPAKKRRLHHGLQLAFLYNAPTLGNSSTALVSGPLWRSQARNALTQPKGPTLLYLQYVSNHLYVYPEHRDHDPGHNGANGKGHGDVFAANTPYMIISQGSSGSDRVFLNAVCATMGAFRPEVKAQLVRSGTLMPAVQMIFRQSNKMVQKPEDYLTGQAHPTVFDGAQVDPVRMVKLAQEMTTEVLPPMVQLHVVEEDVARVGVDYFDVSERERYFDTPCAIARVVKSLKYSRRLVVSADKSQDFTKQPLEYHWVVLRGDPSRIQIKRLNERGSTAEITVSYHPRRPVQPGADLESNRVDIGVFARNDKYYSAPAFVSLFYLDNEKRVYDEKNRIKSVDYADPKVAGNYVDPLLDFPKDWRDEFQYTSSGQLLGWTRVRGDKKEQFTADGALVTKTDEKGRPVEARKVRYLPQAEKNKPTRLIQQVTDEIVRYQYDSPDDRVGRPVESKEQGAGSKK